MYLVEVVLPGAKRITPVALIDSLDKWWDVFVECNAVEGIITFFPVDKVYARGSGAADHWHVENGELIE